MSRSADKNRSTRTEVGGAGAAVAMGPSSVPVAGGPNLEVLDGNPGGCDTDSGFGKSFGNMLKGVDVGIAGSDDVGRCLYVMKSALEDAIAGGSLTGSAADVGNDMISSMSSVDIISRLGAASREELRAKRRNNDLLVPSINYSAFDTTNKNEPRPSANAIKMAKSRAIGAIDKAVKSISDNEDKQACALRLYANKSSNASIVLRAGLKVPDDTEKKLQMLDNLTSHASELFKSDGAAKGFISGSRPD